MGLVNILIFLCINKYTIPGSMRLVGKKKKEDEEDVFVDIKEMLVGVDVYSDKFNSVWNVTLEKSDLGETIEVKPQPQDDDFSEIPLLHPSKPTVFQVFAF